MCSWISRSHVVGKSPGKWANAFQALPGCDKYTHLGNYRQGVYTKILCHQNNVNRFIWWILYIHPPSLERITSICTCLQPLSFMCCGPWWRHDLQLWDPPHKSHNALDKCPTTHHVHISVTKWCTAGYGTGALWDLCSRPVTGPFSYIEAEKTMAEILQTTNAFYWI